MNINRTIRRYSLLLFTLLFMPLIAPSPAQSRMPVKVGVYQNAPLTFIDENGKVGGFFIDILESIAGKENWKIEYVQSSFSECLSNLESGKIDLLGAVAYSKSRGKLFDFTFESVFTNWGQLYINSETNIESIIDLEGKKVAVLQGDIFFDDLSKLVNQFGIQCRFIEAFEYENVLKLVEIGRCQAGLVSQVYGTQHERNYDISKSSILVSPKKIYWAAPKGKSKNILFTLDKRIRELKSDEQSIYYEAINKWFGSGGKLKLGRWFKWIIISVLSLLALFFTSSLILRVQVKSKTKELLIKNEELIEEIKNRKQAEEALRESEERFSGFARASGYGFAMGKLTGQLVFGNPAVLRIVEEEREADFTAKTFYQYYSEEDKRLLRTDILPIVMAKGQWKGEIPLLTAKGNLTPTEQNIFLISDKHGAPRMVGNIITDIIERKLAEETLRESEEKLARSKKMEAVGALAGGVAHDLNNILSGIVSYPELILLDLPEDSPLRKPILTIQESGHKAAVIVQDMLTLARRGVAITEVVNLNDIISNHIESPEHEKLKSFHPGIDFEINLDPDLLSTMGSPVHLSKTIMNLLSNAAEAMPHDGAITMSTSNQYLDRPVRGYEDVQEGDYVVLNVVDSGVGMSEEDLARIFEPFYTKKVMGRSGTGLGMAVVWGTIKDHNGYIDIESTSGRGTRFDLYFPVTRREPAEKRVAVSIEEFMGSERILVVDDIKEQREIASEILTKLGYSVTIVSSGEEAVEYMKENSADLLILDMIMDPGIDGLNTYKKIIQIHPRQKAVIASGFSETDRVKEAQRLGAGAYVKKPYTLEKIGIAVRDELKK